MRSAHFYTITRITLLEVWHNRFPWMVLTLLLLSCGVAFFVADLAVSEVDAFRQSIAGGMLRMGSVLILTVVIATSMAREISDKNHEIALSTTVDRSAYLLAKSCGYFVAAIITAVAAGIALAIIGVDSGAIYWGGTLLLELLVVSAATLFFTATINNANAGILLTLFFYVLARSIHSLSLIAQRPTADSQNLVNQFTELLIQTLSYALPRLDLLAQSSWLTQAIPDTSIWSMLVSSVVYIALLLAAALFDFNRKSF